VTLFADSAIKVISVAELNSLSREALERRFPLVWVSGEISGLMRAGSGHCYFNLKDAFAQVRCVCFRSKFQALDWLPADGARVEVCALVTLYEPRGEFQLNVETVRRSGLGALYEAFEKLKAKLAGEGLFDPAAKKPIPRFVLTIGIVTSASAAALRDVLSILRRRMAAIRVIVYPTPVQGEGAAQRIAEALQLASMRRECEVLILCRGGGSIEDLWAFNEEIVARAIRGSRIPVVSGVGHETDFTIADFAADVRAATPSAAAELVSPSAAELRGKLSSARERLLRSAERVVRTRAQQLDYLSRRLMPPAARLANERERLRHLQNRLLGGWNTTFAARSSAVRELSRALKNLKPDLAAVRESCAKLDSRLRASMRRYLERLELHTNKVRLHLAHLSPQSVLDRGYSIAQQENGKVVRGADEVEIGQTLKITFARGHATTSVTAKS
jgi:exodeoxyribonuclease VII large subunit